MTPNDLRPWGSRRSWPAKSQHPGRRLPPYPPRMGTSISTFADCLAAGGDHRVVLAVRSQG